ncbi:hypothetical protein [Schleiferilactobacillus perolens]|uniref:hypothetical protein n=1 Tax=Schleiferilactobacillus perolens TaxID=100468 RepID=UPI002355DBE5|nr:hypothetical protein [Schleiferilactobacillus perolens]MCI2172290.1 hypothetical protein [Schleiferilactobacillus perolens]
MREVWRDRDKRWTVILLFILAVAGTLFFSHNSPLYYFNEWVDSNAYFTVARGMLNGKTLYAGIFDQKGPYLYFLHVVALILTPHRYWGILPFQMLALFADLVIVYRWARVYLSHKPALLAPMGFLALYFNYIYYQRGDSAEEFCLPFLMLAYYLLTKFLFGEEAPSRIETLIMSFGVGFVLLVKFSLLVPIAAAYLIWWGYMRQRHQYDELKASILWSLVGFLVAWIPVLLYFLVTHAFGALWYEYFYTNLFLYSAHYGNGMLGSVIGKWLILPAQNFSQIPWLFAAIAFSVIVVLVSRYFFSLQSHRWWFLLVIVANYFAVITPIRFNHYYLALLPLIVPGLIMIARWGDRLLGGLQVSALGMIMLSTLVLFLGTMQNPRVASESRLTSGQPVITQITNPIKYDKGAHFMLYKMMDAGYFMVTGQAPQEKYFAAYNITHAAMPAVENSQQKAIKAGKYKYVITDLNAVAEVMQINPRYHIIRSANWDTTHAALMKRE